MRPEDAAAARGTLLGRAAAALVRLGILRPALTLLLAGLLGLAALGTVATRFALDTDVARLFPADLPWRQAERALSDAFPQFDDTIAIVVDGATPDLAERAAAALAEALAARPERFRSVTRPDAEEFFRRNALLFREEAEVQATAERLIAAQPLLGTLAADPSLRGLGRSLALIAEGMAQGAEGAEQFAPALDAFAEAAAAAAAGRTAPLDWSALLTGQPPDPMALRRFVLVQPVLDYTALAPGQAATAAVREAAAAVGATAENGVRVRLTGSIVMADEEFSTVFGGALAQNVLAFAAVGLLLWLALRSGRLILPMMATLVLGLVVTLAFGAVVVGPYNPLSIAFAVLFIGLGVDFGIQFAVRLREQRHRLRDAPLPEALIAAARLAGPGIALAALALCAGFLAFLPTDYRGLAELGLIAAAGMLIAVFLSLTVLPALLALAGPEEEARPVGYAALRPLDRFLARRAGAVAAGILLLALAAAAALPALRFDTNPLNLRDPETEAVSTFRDLMADPETTPNTVQVLAPDLEAAAALAARLESLPEVADARTLADFVPEGQPAKLALIQDVADLLGPTLDPPVTEPPPGDAEAAVALREAAAALGRAAPAA
ncbi:MMPL family transporter, partial [Crenalkalicoccus roseus]|uniref:MMPL family transporter n=1 Tax=Crenalkalicoccus roseus TaxID=1485588 RepID=UPI0010811335